MSGLNTLPVNDDRRWSCRYSKPADEGVVGRQFGLEFTFPGSDRMSHNRECLVQGLLQALRSDSQKRIDNMENDDAISKFVLSLFQDW